MSSNREMQTDRGIREAGLWTLDTVEGNGGVLRRLVTIMCHAHVRPTAVVMFECCAFERQGFT